MENLTKHHNHDQPDSVRGRDRKKLPRFTLSPLLTAAAYLAVSLFAAFSSTALQPGPVWEQLQIYAEQPLLFVLNGFPVFIVTLFLFALFRNVFYSGAAACLIFDLLSYINLLKIEGRDDPFVPADVLLVREGLDAAGNYEMQLHVPLLLFIVFSVVLFAVLGVFAKSAYPRWPFRVVGAALAATAMIASVPLVYQDKALYESFTVPSQYNITSVFNTLGFNYCFLHNYNLYPVEKPADYSASEVARWEQEGLDEQEDAGNCPNVLFVMCESFTDLSNADVFAYSETENPLYDYNEIAQSDQAYAGHIVVANFGAGTANTEYDVLTGLPNSMLSGEHTSAFRTVRRSLNTVARVFSREGCQTYFMHPGNSWFYNRSSVYQFFGFDRQVYNKDAFSENDYKGNMISDEAFVRVLMNDFSAGIAQDAPFFAYTVTIQNHQTYNYAKYGFEPERVPLTKEISDAAMEALSVYMEGIRDSSGMLRKLTEYLDDLQEPVVLVFFGDHRPTLCANYGAYIELGMDIGNPDDPKSAIETNTTPFLIYANKAYCTENDFQERIQALNLPDHGTISSHYLGAAVCQFAHLSGRDGYYDFLNRARQTLPVLCNGNYMLPDGTCTKDLTETEQEFVDKTGKWLYYRMKDQRVAKS